MTDTHVKTDEELLHKNPHQLMCHSKQKLPGVISDKEIDKTLSTIKTVIQNVWLVNKKHTWIRKTSVVKTD